MILCCNPTCELSSLPFVEQSLNKTFRAILETILYEKELRIQLRYNASDTVEETKCKFLSVAFFLVVKISFESTLF